MNPDFTIYPAVGAIILALSAGLSIAGFVLSIRRRRRGGIIWSTFAIVLTAAGLYIMRGQPGANGSLNINGVAIFIVACLGPSIVAFVLGVRPRHDPSGVAPSAPQNQNGLALASVIVVWFSSIVGLILGHVALSQIKRTGETGRGMALTAVIVGWTATGLAIVGTLILVAMYSSMLNTHTY